MFHIHPREVTYFDFDPLDLKPLLMQRMTERVQRVHEPADLWDLFHPLILRLLVLYTPAVLRLRALQDAPAPADPNS